MILMLRMKVRRRKWFYITLLLIFLVFGGTLGSVYYFGNQAIAKQQADTKTKVAALDKKITEIKARKLVEKKAKEEAEKKAAAQKAAADAALAAQLKGQVVTPAGCAVSGAHGNPNQIDVVINKKHCFNPINFVPSDLVSYGGYVVSSKIQPNLAAMFSAAAATGVPLSLTSSYRSYANQVTTYNNWVHVNGSVAAADTVSARPGYSEHQTGFAVDLSAGNCSLECFGKSAQYAWLQTNGAIYGFVQRYPAGLESVTGYSAETWHWRYVGPQVAATMQSSGVKTLEQLWNISGGGY